MGYYKIKGATKWVYSNSLDEYYKDTFGAWTQIINWDNPTKRRLNHTVLNQLSVHEVYQDTEGDEQLYFYNPCYGLYYDYCDPETNHCYYESEQLPGENIAIGIYHRTSDDTYWQYLYDMDNCIIENNLDNTIWHFNEDVYYVKEWDDLDDVLEYNKQRIYQVGNRYYIYYGSEFHELKNYSVDISERQDYADDVEYINNTMFSFTLSTKFNENYTIRGWNYCGFYGDWVRLTQLTETSAWTENANYYNAASQPSTKGRLYHIHTTNSKGVVFDRWKWFVPDYSFVGTDQNTPTKIETLPKYPTARYPETFESAGVSGSEFIYYTIPLYQMTDDSYWYWALDLNLIPLPDAPPGHFYQWITVNGKKSDNNSESLSDLFHSYGKASMDSYGNSYIQNLYFADIYNNGWANKQGNGGTPYYEWMASPGMDVGTFKNVVFTLPTGARYKMFVRYSEDFCSPTIYWGYVYEEIEGKMEGILYLDTKPVGGTHSGSFGGEQKFSRYNTPWEKSVGAETFREQLTRVDFRGEIVPKYLDDWFYKCDHLKSVLHCENLNTIQTISCYETFCECQLLEDIDTSTWYMNKLVDMSYMFQSCRKIKSLDLRYWDPSKLTKTTQAFNECYELEVIYVSSLWDNTTVPKRITNDYKMFSQCVRLAGDVSYLDTGGDMTKKRFVYTNGYLTFKERDVVWEPIPAEDNPDIIIKRNPHFTNFEVDSAEILPLFNESDTEYTIDLYDEYVAHASYAVNSDTDELYLDKMQIDLNHTDIVVENENSEQAMNMICKYCKSDKVGDADVNKVYKMHFKTTAKNLPLLNDMKTNIGSFVYPFYSKVLNYTYYVNESMVDIALIIDKGKNVSKVTVTNGELSDNYIFVHLDGSKTVTIKTTDKDGRSLEYTVQFVMMPYLTELYCGSSEAEPSIDTDASVYELYVPSTASEAILHMDWSTGVVTVKHDDVETTEHDIKILLPTDMTTGDIELINDLYYSKKYHYRIVKREGVDVINISAQYREAGTTSAFTPITLTPTFTKDTTLYTGELIMLPDLTSEIEFTIDVGDDVTDVTKIIDDIETEIPVSSTDKRYITTINSNNVTVDFGMNKEDDE